MRTKVKDMRSRSLKCFWVACRRFMFITHPSSWMLMQHSTRWIIRDPENIIQPFLSGRTHTHTTTPPLGWVEFRRGKHARCTPQHISQRKLIISKTQMRDAATVITDADVVPSFTKFSWTKSRKQFTHSARARSRSHTHLKEINFQNKRQQTRKIGIFLLIKNATNQSVTTSRHAHTVILESAQSAHKGQPEQPKCLK